MNMSLMRAMTRFQRGAGHCCSQARSLFYVSFRMFVNLFCVLRLISSKAPDVVAVQVSFRIRRSLFVCM